MAGAGQQKEAPRPSGDWMAMFFEQEETEKLLEPELCRFLLFKPA